MADSRSTNPDSSHEPDQPKGDARPVPTRIAFCITELDPGGAERALTHLVLHLDRSQWQPHVFCLGPRGHFAEILEAQGVPVTCLNARGSFSLIRVVYRLTRELRRFQPAIVQTFLFHANIVGRIAARLAGAKVVVSGIRVAERRAAWHGTVDRWTNSLVDMNVCVSEGVAAFSQQTVGLPPGKLVVIPNSVNVELFAKAQAADLTELGIPADHRVFLSIGRLDRQKGFDVLIEAVKSMTSLPLDVCFLIVGEGPESANLRQQVAQAGLSGRIHFSPRRGDIPNLMASSLALILPSRWEGMPNVVLEAMAAARTVIATRVEGIPELVQQEVTGYIVAPESASELATAIGKVCSSPDFVRDAGNASQAIVRERFTIDATADSYQQLYRKLLNSPAR